MGRGCISHSNLNSKDADHSARRAKRIGSLCTNHNQDQWNVLWLDSGLMFFLGVKTLEIGSKKKKKPTRPPKCVNKTESDLVCIPLAVVPFTKFDIARS